jgi:hypothetical protein
MASRLGALVSQATSHGRSIKTRSTRACGGCVGSVAEQDSGCEERSLTVPARRRARCSRWWRALSSRPWGVFWGGSWQLCAARAEPLGCNSVSHSSDPDHSCSRWQTNADSAGSGADEERQPRKMASQPPGPALWTTTTHPCEALSVLVAPRLVFGWVVEQRENPGGYRGFLLSPHRLPAEYPTRPPAALRAG